LNHNRDIGLLAHDRLVVLGLMQTVEFYEGNPKLVDMSRMTQTAELELELEKDATALYQIADDLYVHQRYRLDTPGFSARVPEPIAQSNSHGRFGLPVRSIRQRLPLLFSMSKVFCLSPDRTTVK
jgi:hypothetical protein